MRARFLLLPLLLTLAGCDQVADVIGVDSFDVDLGDDAQLPIVPAPPGTTVSVAVGTTVNLNVELPDVFDVTNISIPEDAATYEPTAQSIGAACTIDLYVMIDEVPALQAEVEVDEGDDPALQDVNSVFASPYDRDAICGDLGDDCPVTEEPLQRRQILERVNAAVHSGSFRLDLVPANDGPCAGLLTIERLHFDLDF